MRQMLLLAALAVLPASGWQSADLENIRQALASLNVVFRTHSASSVKALFTSGTPVAEVEAVIDALPKPMSEVSTPVLERESIRLVSPDVAVVDAFRTQYGSVVVRSSIPVMLVMKKEAGAWKIAALRFGCAQTYLPSQAW